MNSEIRNTSFEGTPFGVIFMKFMATVVLCQNLDGLTLFKTWIYTAIDFYHYHLHDV